MDPVIRNIISELSGLADEKTRESSRRFFKEPVLCHGVKSAIVHKVSSAHLSEIKQGGKEKVFELCGQLWQTGYLEESIVACNWSYAIHKQFMPADFKVFEGWIDKYVTNWAACDTLCNHTVGKFVDMYPAQLKELKEFTHSSNRWKKRAAAVSLIIPARQGNFLADIFEIANLLIDDKDDMVQKGYGWMLKAASESDRQAVFDFVMSRRETMPRTAFRYAIEKLPPEMKKTAMQRQVS